MYFNNRNNQTGYGMGCSILGCLAVLFIGSLIIRGGVYFFFRYFWVILLLGAIVWIFRKFTQTDHHSNTQDKSSKGPDWRRDYENRSDTGYDNVDRDFEEVDEDEEDDFNDF